MSEIGARLIAAVREIADEQPDYRYDEARWGGCQYVVQEHDECGDLIEPDSEVQPGCLIGQALWRLGIISGAFINNDLNVETSVKGLVSGGVIDRAITQNEIDWLEVVQDTQDGGRSWGHAVDYADSEAPLV